MYYYLWLQLTNPGFDFIPSPLKHNKIIITYLRCVWACKAPPLLSLGKIISIGHCWMLLTFWPCKLQVCKEVCCIFLSARRGAFATKSKGTTRMAWRGGRVPPLKKDIIGGHAVLASCCVPRPYITAPFQHRGPFDSTSWGLKWPGTALMFHIHLIRLRAHHRSWWVSK